MGARVQRRKNCPDDTFRPDPGRDCAGRYCIFSRRHIERRTWRRYPVDCGSGVERRDASSDNTLSLSAADRAFQLVTGVGGAALQLNVATVLAHDCDDNPRRCPGGTIHHGD